MPGLGCGAVLAVVAGVAAIVGIAAVVATPAVFLAAGLVAFALVDLAGVTILTKTVDDRHRRFARIGAFVGTAVAVLGLVVVTAVLPGTTPARRRHRSPASGSGGCRPGPGWPTSTWPRGASKPMPVVVVQGGPGVSDLAGDVSYVAPLTADGFDVYVYDQLGSGGSSRLDDPRATPSTAASPTSTRSIRQ